MDYIRTKENEQATFTHSTEFLLVPSSLYGFHNTETNVRESKSGRDVFCHTGLLEIPEEERIVIAPLKRQRNNLVA